jgi:hypothetical protein
MSSCEHEIEVEDLAIGLLDGEEAACARRHLETCDVCQDAYAGFARERSLFEARAQVVPPAPFTEPEMLESVVTIAHTQRRATVLRFARTVVAFAACAAAIFGSVWMNEHVIGPSSESHAAAASSSSSGNSGVANMSSSSVSMSTTTTNDESEMACAFPMSGSFREPTSDVVASSALEAPASIGSIAEHATCEAPLSSSGSSMISWRVTSSFATP